MTTILADLRLGVMVSDSNVSNGDRVWRSRKVWRSRGALLGFSGNVDEARAFLDWWRAGAIGKHPGFAYSEALILSIDGVWHYSGNRLPERIASGREAIGTGGKAAMAAYEALAWQEPRRAVRIACNHDSDSRAPVRVYSL